MTLLPQVRSQLDAAARRTATIHRRSGGGPRLRTIARSLPVTLSVLTALVIAIVAVTVLHHDHAGPTPPAHPTGSRTHPRPVLIGRPSPAQQAIEADIGKADKQTRRSDPACVNSNRGPTTVTSSPGPALLSQLGVLRRPAIRSPTLKTLLGGGFTAGSRVDINYIRLARIVDGRAFYLIPEGNPSGLGSIPARCYTEMRTHLERIILNLPASERASALRQQAQGFRATRVLTHQAALCFAVVTTRHVRPPNGVNSGCASTTSFLQPGLDGGIGLGDRAGGQVFAAIVPDAVTTVTLKFRSSRRDPARTLTSQAINNVVVFKIPRRTADPDFPSAIIRLAANGQIVTRTS